MGRPKSLSPKQIEEACALVANGESYRSVSRRFGVDDGVIRREVKALRELAGDVAAEVVLRHNNTARLKRLTAPEQNLVHSMAGILAEISEHLAGAARYGAKTAHRLHRIAHQEAEKIDPNDPLGVDSHPHLVAANSMLEVAGKASYLGEQLVRANRDAVQPTGTPEPGKPLVEYTDAELLALATRSMA